MLFCYTSIILAVFCQLFTVWPIMGYIDLSMPPAPHPQPCTSRVRPLACRCLYAIFRELLLTTRNASDYPSQVLIPCLAPLATPSLAIPHDDRPASTLSDAPSHPPHIHMCTNFTHRICGKACRSSKNGTLRTQDVPFTPCLKFGQSKPIQQLVPPFNRGTLQTWEISCNAANRHCQDLTTAVRPLMLECAPSISWVDKALRAQNRVKWPFRPAGCNLLVVWVSVVWVSRPHLRNEEPSSSIEKQLCFSPISMQSACFKLVIFSLLSITMRYSGGASWSVRNSIYWKECV